MRSRAGRSSRDAFPTDKAETRPGEVKEPDTAQDGSRERETTDAQNSIRTHPALALGTASSHGVSLDEAACVPSECTESFEGGQCLPATACDERQARANGLAASAKRSSLSCFTSIATSSR